jgi:hypothetical protein
MIVALVYLFRAAILDVIERRFDILTITQFVIDLLSVPVTRIIVGTGFFAVLLAVAAAPEAPPRVGVLATLLIACGMLAALLLTTATSLRRGLIVALILSLNLAPAAVFERVRRLPRIWNMLMLTGIGIAELLFAREYWDWMRGQDRTATPRAMGCNPDSGPAPRLARTGRADTRPTPVAVEQKLRLSDDVKVIERGLSLNWIQLDPSGSYLYVTGHDVPRLRRYDVRNLDAPPLQSDAATGATGLCLRSVGQPAVCGEYVHQALLYLDATTLKLQKTADLAQLSPGNPWIAVDAQTDTLTVVSEADERIGDPLIVLERSSGRTVARADLDAGNILKDPSRPWLYLTFLPSPERGDALRPAGALGNPACAGGSASRTMAFWKSRNELLVTSPIESRVLRFDADTLAPKVLSPRCSACGRSRWTKNVSSCCVATSPPVT